jgi:hypothetical protein
LQTLPSISTNSPYASMIPVAYTLFSGVILELIADLKRRKNDQKINNTLVRKLYIDQTGLIFTEDTRSADLKVGDVILVENNT